MGGRHALQLAVDRPDLVERVVLIGASPGIQDDSERAARRSRDRELAGRLEAVGVDRFLTEWLAQPLFATLPPEAHQLGERRRNTVEGLSTSLRMAGTGAQLPLWDALPGVDVPVLLLAGALDARYAAVAHRMHDAIGDNATVVTIADAGHAVHLEQPLATAEVVARFLGD
jgi:2-succinyl-6-hydroxy-2,4-cyclohexadiene-1-carboxylate synthase